MDKKATGWVPDYPDIKDYTLSSKAIRSVLNPVQGTQIAGTLESQKENILKLLKLIATQAEKKEITNIQQQIDLVMNNEVNLVEVEVVKKETFQDRKDKNEIIRNFDLERIPSQVFQIILEKLLPNIGVTYIKSSDHETLIQLVYPIAKVIAQIISPIAQKSNIEKVVSEKGIKYFKTLIDFDGSKDSKNYSLSDYQTMPQWKFENDFFKYLACSAVLDVKLKIEKLKTRQNIKWDFQELKKVNLAEEEKEIYEKVEEELQPYFQKALELKNLPFKDQKVLEFDGEKGYVDIESFKWVLKQPVTVEFWTKVNEADCLARYAFTVGKQTDQNYFRAIFTANPPRGNALLSWEYGAYRLVVDYKDYLNEWTHVALVFEGKNSKSMHIYLNGEKVDPLVISGNSSSPNTTLEGLLIGTSGTFDCPNFYKGKIAEFRIWKKACSLKEIQDNMFKQPSSSKDRLEGYWAFDEGEGDKVADKAGFNHSGVLSGNPTPKWIDLDKSIDADVKKWVCREGVSPIDDFVPKTVFKMKEPQAGKEESRSEEQETESLQFPILNKYRENIKNANITLPEFVDLSFWCSPVEAQGSLNSCTANAAVTLMEYFQNKSFGKYIDGSRLFLYKATRNLMQIEGNVGTSIRSTMKAMALFGVPPEEYWPYQEDKVNDEPNPFCYAFAQNYQALKYFRLDTAGIQPDLLLAQIKTILVAGIPCVFGFTLYHSIYDDSNPRGHIPLPHKRDKAEGGHAVVAVGYDDYKQIENADSRKSPGALLIRNCWGTQWGEGGYGWLPYEYVLKGLTADWWSLLSSEWFDTEQFGLGGKDWTDNVGVPPGSGQGC